MGRFLRGRSFDLCRPKSDKAIMAEASYNNSVMQGESDADALAALVQEHTALYPFGIDPNHARKPNGNDNSPPG
jgi:hypothetical protein